MEAQSQATQTDEVPVEDSIETTVQLSEEESFTIPDEGDHFGPLEEAPAVDVVENPEYALYLNAVRTLRDRHGEISVGTPAKINAYTDADMPDLKVVFHRSLSTIGSHMNRISPIEIPGFEFSRFQTSIVSEDVAESDEVEMAYVLEYERTA